MFQQREPVYKMLLHFWYFSNYQIYWGILLFQMNVACNIVKMCFIKLKYRGNSILWHQDTRPGVEVENWIPYAQTNQLQWWNVRTEMFIVKRFRNVDQSKAGLRCHHLNYQISCKYFWFWVELVCLFVLISMPECGWDVCHCWIHAVFLQGCFDTHHATTNKLLQFTNWVFDCFLI